MEKAESSKRQVTKRPFEFKGRRTGIEIKLVKRDDNGIEDVDSLFNNDSFEEDFKIKKRDSTIKRLSFSMSPSPERNEGPSVFPKSSFSPIKKLNKEISSVPVNKSITESFSEISEPKKTVKKVMEDSDSETFSFGLDIDDELDPPPPPSKQSPSLDSEDSDNQDISTLISTSHPKESPRKKIARSIQKTNKGSASIKSILSKKRSNPPEEENSVSSPSTELNEKKAVSTETRKRRRSSINSKESDSKSLETPSDDFSYRQSTNLHKKPFESWKNERIIPIYEKSENGDIELDDVRVEEAAPSTAPKPTKQKDLKLDTTLSLLGTDVESSIESSNYVEPVEEKKPDVKGSKRKKSTVSTVPKDIPLYQTLADIIIGQETESKGDEASDSDRVVYTRKMKCLDYHASTIIKNKLRCLYPSGTKKEQSITGMGTFNVPSLFTSGRVLIPPQTSKPVEYIPQFNQFFIVTQCEDRTVEIHINDDRFLLSTGDHIYIPSKNTYTIINHSLTITLEITFIVFRHVIDNDTD